MLFFWSSVCIVEAQDSYYDHIDLGKYKINYTDTLIYDSEIKYNQYEYSGSAPLFVQVWYPSAKKKNIKKINFGAYRFSSIPTALTQVYEKLSAQMNDMIIRDGIALDINTDELIDYGNLTTLEILDKIQNLATRSSRVKLNSTLQYPVIVYHHGSQGLSNENFIMAEYFASHGYIFISSNFHLPYENAIYGLLPFHLEKESKHDQSSAKTLINFAKSISPKNKVFFIGHSWGAQEGWCFLHDSTWTDAFVSMETTLEFKKDSTQIKELWPYVWEAIKIKKNTFSIPILSFAAKDDNLNFDFFKNLSSKTMIFASYINPFAHNSYTSIYMLRYFLSKEIIMPDDEVLLKQIEGYAEHLELIRTFFESILKNEKIDLAPFNKNFQFEYTK